MHEENTLIIFIPLACSGVYKLGQGKDLPNPVTDRVKMDVYWFLSLE